VGFIFLSLILLFTGSWALPAFGSIPALNYCGGVIGAVFVALSSFVFPRLDGCLCSAEFKMNHLI
jgi:transporter family-2 protein